MKRAIVKTIGKGLSVGYLKFELRDEDNRIVGQSVNAFKSLDECVSTLSSNFPQFVVVDDREIEVELVDE